MKSADIEAEWQIAPGASGKPALASVVPGGSLTFEHRNIARRGRQVRLHFLLPVTGPLNRCSKSLPPRRNMWCRVAPCMVEVGMMACPPVSTGYKVPADASS